MGKESVTTVSCPPVSRQRRSGGSAGPSGYRELHLFVLVQGNRFQLTEPDQIRPDQDPQLFSLPLPPFPIPAMALVLHSDPEFVHLGKIHQDKIDAVAHLKPDTEHRQVGAGRLIGGTQAKTIQRYGEAVEAASGNHSCSEAGQAPERSRR